jgi:hypothetical protein
MLRFASAGLLVVAFSARSLAAQVAPEKLPGMTGSAAPALIVAEPHVDFPDGYQGSLARHTFAFRNTGKQPVRIVQGIALSGSGDVQFEPALVPPGASGVVRVSQPLHGLGRASFRFALVTDEPGVARYRMSLSGFIESAYEPEQARLDFGQIERGQTGQASLELFSREVDALRVLRVSGAPSYLDVQAQARAGLADEGVMLRATLRPDAPLGLTSGVLKLETNVAAQPFYELAYTLRVFGDVLPSEQPVALGLVRAGEPAAGQVLLRSRSGAPVQVLSVKDPSGVVDVEVQPCGTGCARLVLDAYTETLGSLAGTLEVRLAGSSDVLPLRYVGWVITPQAEVRTLDLDAPVSTPKPAAPAAPPAPSPASAPTPSAAPKERRETRPALPTQVRLEWKTRHDSEVQGYVVYRAERPEGPFRRVSPRLIPVPPGEASTREYLFVDEGVRAGAAYYYYLDVVGIDGRKRRFSGVQARRVAPGPG